MKAVNLLFLFTTFLCYGQLDVPLTLRHQFNGPYGYTIIGNTLNEFDNLQKPAPPCRMLTSSSATLNLLPTQNIVAAYLYWGGIGDGFSVSAVQLNDFEYTAMETVVGRTEISGAKPYFSSSTNVTNQVKTTGNGTYTFANLNLNPLIANYCSSGTYNAGWHIVVIYDQSTLPNNQINIYNGISIVDSFLNRTVKSISINNLNVTNTQNALMTYVGLNGSPNLFDNESVSFNNNVLSNALNPPNNPFNGSNSFTGSTTNWNQDIDTFDISPYLKVGDTQTNFTFKSFYFRFIHTLVTSISSELPDATINLETINGQDICNNRDLLVNFSVSNNTNNNAVLSANVPISFYADNFFLSTITTPTSIAVGGKLNMESTVRIPSNIPNNFNLRIAVNNTIDNQNQVPESNDSNNNSVKFIRMNIGVKKPTFTIRTVFCKGNPVPSLPSVSTNGIEGVWTPNVIDNQVSGSYTFVPNDSQCTSPLSIDIAITTDDQITPFFATQPVINCIVPPPLVSRTISSNGITGSWSLSNTNNQNLQNAVFTPDPGQCASAISVGVSTLVGIPRVTPSFSLPRTVFCEDYVLPDLPSISDNGITGIWSPSIVSANNNTDYTFIPNPGQCALWETVRIDVRKRSTPKFILATTICKGKRTQVLPIISEDGVIGTWKPNAIDNQNNGTYVFTPNVGQCANRFVLNIEVKPIETTIFSIPNVYCEGSAIPILPTISDNGFLGTWSPSVISNQSSGDYIFTPNVGQCGDIYTLIVTIRPQPPQTQNVVLCYNEQGNTIVPMDLNSNLNPNDFAFVWTFNNQNINQTKATISADAVGNYQLIATPKNNNCRQVFNFNVTALQPLTAIYTVSDDFEPNQTIKVEASGGSGAYSYSFDNSPFQNYPIFSVRDGGEILVKIRDNSSCYEVSKVITLWQYPRFFTPNNDGYNDSWGIKTQQKITVAIFDRYGKLLKQLKTNERWNGTFNAQSLPADDYWFVLTYNDEQIFKGHFTLKR